MDYFGYLKNKFGIMLNESSYTTYHQSDISCEKFFYFKMQTTAWCNLCAQMKINI